MYRPPRLAEGWSVTGGTVIHRQADAGRALVLHADTWVAQLVVRTLEHGLFVVRAARTLRESEAILAGWRPDLAVVDLDHRDSPALLLRLGASNSPQHRSGTPILGLTRRGDLQARLGAFTLGVDDVLAVPFAPQELLARAIVISRAASRTLVSARPAPAGAHDDAS